MNDRPEEPEWLTDMDKEILEVLSSELILTPSIIAENINRSRKGVSNRINSLQAGGLVEKVERGKYRITDEGLTIWKITDQDRFRNRRLDVTQRRLIQDDLGVSREEYLGQVRKEYERLKDEEEDIDEPFEEAFERVEERLREENEADSSSSS